MFLVPKAKPRVTLESNSLHAIKKNTTSFLSDMNVIPKNSRLTFHTQNVWCMLEVACLVHRSTGPACFLTIHRLCTAEYIDEVCSAN